MPAIRLGAIIRTGQIPFHCGDVVRLKADPRHVGEIQSIQGMQARVRFDETGWLSDLDFDEIELTSRENNEVAS